MLSADSSPAQFRAWAATAVRRFAVRADRSPHVREALAVHASSLARALAAGNPGAFADELLKTVAALDDGSVAHADGRLSSFVDASLQAALCAAFAGALAESPRELVRTVLEARPHDRPALLAYARLSLDDGDADAALEAAQRALRVQAICPDAQSLMIEAYRARPEPAPEYLDRDLSDRFCTYPFVYYSGGHRGNVFNCSCPAWLPFAAGNLLDAPDADAVLNHPVAREIRRSILDGDFRYCSRTMCTKIISKQLPLKSEVTDPVFRRHIDERLTVVTLGPHAVDLNYDPTCNLACPSCRTELIAGDDDRLSGARDRVVLPMLARTKGQTYISGGGEAFSSKHFRSVLARLNRREYPDLDVFLITNGLLLTPQRWAEYPDLPAVMSHLAVSIDAARPETYEVLRRPGKWSALMPNLEHAASLRRAGTIRQFWINFVVQQANFREMREFVALGDRLGADRIWFQRVTSYGSYEPETFAQVDVTAPSHPEHAELLAMLRHPDLGAPHVDLVQFAFLLPERSFSEPAPGTASLAVS